MLERKKVENGKVEIVVDLSELSSGLYFIKLSGDSNIVKRFIKL